MAKKNADRKEEARQRRLAETRKRQRRARQRKIATWAVVAVVVAGAGIGIAMSQKGSKKKVTQLTQLAAAAGCDAPTSPKDLGRDHVDPPKIEQYSSTPPTSGPHYPSPAQTGVHTTQIQNEEQVHNLEHGHVIFHTNGASDALISQLENLVNTDPTRLIVEPYPSMPYKIAMTAWDHLIGCTNPNDKVMDLARQFVTTYKGKGPEGDLPGKPVS